MIFALVAGAAVGALAFRVRGGWLGDLWGVPGQSSRLLYAALMAAVQTPDQYRCVIAVAALSDLNLHWKWGDTQRSRYGRNFLERAMGSSLFSRTTHAVRVTPAGLAFAERAGSLSQARREELAGLLAEPLQVLPEQAEARLNGIARGLLGAS